MQVVGAILLLVAAAQAQTTPPTFQDLSTQAQQAYDANDLPEAAQLFSRALKLKSDWAEGWWALGMIHYQLDEYPACREALTQMVQLDSSAAPGWALLGLCEFNTREYDASLQHLKKAHMLISPKQGGGQLLDIANFHLAQLLAREGAFEVAEEIYLDVALRVRNNPEMMFGAGVACLRMPMLPSDVPADQRDVVTMAGRAFWDLAAETPEKTEADFLALVNKYPNFPNVHFYYGTYLAAHHPEQCVDEYLKELHVNPRSVPTRVELTRRYVVERKFDEAIKYAREAVALSPESVGAQLALGQVYQAQGKDELALVPFSEAKRIDPLSPNVRMYLVNTYRALGKVEDMRRELAEYKRLKTDQPNWP